ncbi:hypothetical protein T12_10818 [Trichinella patagoniensis]|uniref:Uncharacterized protein n=1 Tax=Trichinella patagoniensis TaxID=990121 RepID=A0A0V0ZKZ2_9BILA|nr:hypothetical protein T12_10818 [Trichinella patagoniensis]
MIHRAVLSECNRRLRLLSSSRSNYFAYFSTAAQFRRSIQLVAVYLLCLTTTLVVHLENKISDILKLISIQQALLILSVQLSEYYFRKFFFFFFFLLKLIVQNGKKIVAFICDVM